LIRRRRHTVATVGRNPSPRRAIGAVLVVPRIRGSALQRVLLSRESRTRRTERVFAGFPWHGEGGCLRRQRRCVPRQRRTHCRQLLPGPCTPKVRRGQGLAPGALRRGVGLLPATV